MTAQDLIQERPVTSEKGTRATDDVCETLGEGRYRIDDRDVTLPVVVRSCAMLLNAFLVDAKAAQRLIDPTGFTVHQAMPGKGFFQLMMRTVSSSWAVGAPHNVYK